MIKYRNARFTLNGFLISIAQELAAIFYRIFLNLTGGYKAIIRIPDELGHNQRYVIAANHQSKLDPFAIFTLAKAKQRFHLLPIKFMTIPWVYHHPLLKPALFILGSFPAHNKQRPHHTFGVEGSVKLLHSGYNICIFPEAHRTLRKDSQPRPGVTRILAEYPQAKLLLAHIEWRRYSFWRRHVTVVLAEAPDSLDKTDPKAIMDAIYAL
ncbi:MAG TPA: lysophospholipid acyltransferase family protein [Candidatus Saccharimonadales bacterium]|nr:lysophospholipid acyltransferase family protein [Candidatus Saccharimonadales bacterium]